MTLWSGRTLLGVCRTFRSRARENEGVFEEYVLSNPKVLDAAQSRLRLLSVNNAFNETVSLPPKSWPPVAPGPIINVPYCRTLLRELQLGEIDRMKKLQPFVMPRIALGDLVQVRYELSRTNQTFSVFEGYCIKIAKKGLNASFSLKGVYDGIAVDQLFPFYSPRLLDVRILKSANPTLVRSASSPRRLDRNYRYQWHTYVRHLYSEGFRVRWRQIRQHPGVMSLEPRLKREIANLRRQYLMMRKEAGLPSYVWPGPYQVHQRQSREVNAERTRRMLVYAWDAKRVDHAKIRAKRARWGKQKALEQPESIFNQLPRDHSLLPGNLPK